MAHLIFADRENAGHAPTLKMRPRLYSSPGLVCQTPLPSDRKAFGAVNKISTPAVNTEDKKLLKVQETKVTNILQSKIEEYPEIEKFIPYDPLDFEKYSVPEDLVPLSGLALPGLAGFPNSPSLCDDTVEKFDPLPNLSPVKMPKRSGDCAALDDFLQTLDELTVELPPEPVTDY